ncbi:MAG: nucleoside deaminase [Planctomycetota bacterium]|nr:MAG: nucleoside deaminase [Planctomycetota bacterium]
MPTDDLQHLRRAIALSQEGMEREDGGPFGAVIVKAGRVVAEGNNRVVVDADPTAHAEVVAIRRACAELGDFSLAGAVLYASCEPCPMCLAAAYWSRVDRVVFAGGRQDAAAIGFDDAFFYEQLPLPIEQRSLPMTQQLRDEAVVPMRAWQAKQDKTLY